MIFKSKVLEIYMDAAPYISNVSWAKEVILKALDESINLEEFEEKIKKLYEKQEEIVKKNDLKIFLNFLKKELK
jgi:methionyl-tRNA synthetase